MPWEEPGWLAQVEDWVLAELNRSGLRQRSGVELVRTRPWAAIARVSTASGTVWFKESAPSLSFEPAVTVAVSRAFPDFAPRVLATLGSWMLTLDAGVQLRDLYRRRAAAPSWDDLLPRYAELQIGLAKDVEKFLVLGVPDKRPSAVASAYPGLVDRVLGRDTSAAERLRRLAPSVASLADALADGLSSTVIHEEAHEANIFVRRGRARLLDWAEVSASHPFAGMVNTLRDIAYRRRLRPNGREMLRLRSVYLEPWTRHTSTAELSAMFDRGYLFGTLCRAMAWDQILADQPPEVRAEYGRNAVVWLDIFREGVERGVRLGAS
jgi:hypothetical protein